MVQDKKQDGVGIQNENELFDLFTASEKAKSEWRIGAEAEKFGVDATTGAPLRYESSSPQSVQTVLRSLVEHHGWTPEPEHEGGPMIALRRGQASVTLEPGSQLELSGAPLPDIHAIDEETRHHLDELKAISAQLNLAWLGVGFHPFATPDAFDWVPKARYGIMRTYLPTQGAHALDMMRRTATVQANFDYSDERDAMRKLRVALKLSPVTTAMFANSPFYEGKPFGGKSYRAHVWLDVDPTRQGLVPSVWKDASTYGDYLQWALDAPMFLVKRDGQVMNNTGQSFRQFMQQGFQGYRATPTDWEMHLNTMFPEVRLKRTLEIRGADSLPLSLASALPALWTGILYDDQALSQAEALVSDFRHEEAVALRPHIAKQALQAPWRQGTLVALAEKVIEIAQGGLQRRAHTGAEGNDERVYLKHLSSLVEQGKCPADALLDAVPTTQSAQPPTREIIQRSRLF